MPTYSVTDPTTGRSLKLTGDSPPTEQELNDIFGSVGGTSSQSAIPAPAKPPEEPGVTDILKKRGGDAYRAIKRAFDEPSTMGRPAGLYSIGETAIAAGGAINDIVGLGLEKITDTSLGRELTEPIRQSGGALVNPALRAIGGYLSERPQLAKDVQGLADASGLFMAPAVGSAAKLAAPLAKEGALIAGDVARIGGRSVATGIKNTVGKVAKEIEGAATGRGPGFIEEMQRGGKAAQRAMRGKITGEEIVEHAKQGLQKVVDKRGEAYRTQLEQVRANPEELSRVRQGTLKKIEELSNPDNFQLGITTDAKTGKPVVDFSESTIIEHQPVVQKAVADVMTWTDDTAAGLDTLTKRLSTYVDQAGRGTPAESFVTQLRNNVSKGLKKNIPGYDAMTKGYREATNLIKDIESNLMLRKEGMSGRITADQTLRRLSSALRENFEMRNDLMQALGAESGMDIPGEVAGYAARQWMPAGLAGKLMTHPLTVGAGAYATATHLINPFMWPLLAASSPRAVGEFLNAYGKARNALFGKQTARQPFRPWSRTGQAIREGMQPTTLESYLSPGDARVPVTPFVGGKQPASATLEVGPVRSGVTVGEPYGPPAATLIERKQLPPGQGFEFRDNPDVIDVPYTTLSRRTVGQLEPPTEGEPLRLGLDRNRGEGFSIAAGMVEQPIVTSSGKPFVSEKSATQAGVKQGIDWKLYEITPSGDGFAITRKIGREIRTENTPKPPTLNAVDQIRAERAAAASSPVISGSPFRLESGAVQAMERLGLNPAEYRPVQTPSGWVVTKIANPSRLPEGGGRLSAPASKSKGPQNLIAYLDQQGGVNFGPAYDQKIISQHPDGKRIARRSGMAPDVAAEMLNGEGWVQPNGKPWTADSLAEMVKSNQGRNVFAPEKMDDIINRKVENAYAKHYADLAAEYEAESASIARNEKGQVANDLKGNVLDEIKNEGISILDEESALRELSDFFDKVSGTKPTTKIPGSKPPASAELRPSGEVRLMNPKTIPGNRSSLK